MATFSLRWWGSQPGPTGSKEKEKASGEPPLHQAFAWKRSREHLLALLNQASRRGSGREDNPRGREGNEREREGDPFLVNN